MGGLQKLITVLSRFDTYKGRVRIKLIKYICIKTMSGKGGEAKKDWIKFSFLCEYVGPTSFLCIYYLCGCVCVCVCLCVCRCGITGGNPT